MKQQHEPPSQHRTFAATGEEGGEEPPNHRQRVREGANGPAEVEGEGEEVVEVEREEGALWWDGRVAVVFQRALIPRPMIRILFRPQVLVM